MGSLWPRQQPPAQGRHVIGYLWMPLMFLISLMIWVLIPWSTVMKCKIIIMSQSVGTHWLIDSSHPRLIHIKWHSFTSFPLSFFTHLTPSCSPSPHPQVCDTQAEARRDAARVALMNSLVNELPCRRINSQFITQSLQQAATDSAVSVSQSANIQYYTLLQELSLNMTCTVSVKVSIEDACDSSTSIGTYSLLLHSYTGRTMLEFQVKYKAKAYSAKWYFCCSCAHKSCGNCMKDLFTSKDSSFVKYYFPLRDLKLCFYPKLKHYHFT